MNFAAKERKVSYLISSLLDIPDGIFDETYLKQVLKLRTSADVVDSQNESAYPSWYPPLHLCEDKADGSRGDGLFPCARRKWWVNL